MSTIIEARVWHVRTRLSSRPRLGYDKTHDSLGRYGGAFEPAPGITQIKAVSGYDPLRSPSFVERLEFIVRCTADLSSHTTTFQLLILCIAMPPPSLPCRRRALPGCGVSPRGRSLGLRTSSTRPPFFAVYAWASYELAHCTPQGLLLWISLFLIGSGRLGGLTVCSV